LNWQDKAKRRVIISLEISLVSWCWLSLRTRH